MEGRVRTLAKKEGKSGEDTRRERGATNGYKHTKCSREVRRNTLRPLFL